MRNYQSLTLGDTVEVEYNNKVYKLDVLLLTPEDDYSMAVSITGNVQTDRQRERREREGREREEGGIIS